MYAKLNLLAILMLTICACSPQSSHDNPDSKSIERYTGPIIDMHIHAYDKVNPLFEMEMGNPLTGKSYTGPGTLEKHQEETFARFRKYNIVKAVVSHHAEKWYEEDTTLVLKGKGHHYSIEELRALYQQGNLDILGEIAPNYNGILPTDASLTAYYDLAVELDIPIGFHMYPGRPPGGAYFAYPKTRAHHGKPLQLEEILINRPKMRIYIMHAGWPYLEDMKALMYAHLQVYVDVGVISWRIPRKEFHNFLQGLVEAGFGKRIMFGSDQMQWAETIDEAIEAVNSAEFLSLAEKEDIFYNNAATFLRLSETAIEQHKQSRRQ